MKGDGGESSVVRDFLSLGSHGSSSRCGSGSGGSGGSEGVSGRGVDDPFSSFQMLSSLSRNGLSMLAGGSSGGFSLMPPAVDSLASLRNLAMGGGGPSSKVTGGGFTGFYRASASKSSNGSNGLLLPGMKLRVGKEENEEGKLGAGAATSSQQRSGIAELALQTDVENLTPDECWRLILKLGSRWPALHETTATQAPQGAMKDRSSTKNERAQGLQLGQDSLRFLASRALEALAQIPDRHGRPAGGMPAPKWTSHEMANTKAPTTPASKSTQQRVATVAEQPSLLARRPFGSSQEMAAPKATSSESRTAPLTIFYAGTVNVCDNVPEDKAHLIMLFADKAGGAPSADASPQVTTPSKYLYESGRPQEELELSKASSELTLVTSPGPSDLAPSADHAEGRSSARVVASAEIVPAESSPSPVEITITEDKSQKQRQQGSAKPLPNARKNSLARFLDSRKRNRPVGLGSEGQPAKRLALSDASPSGDAEDVNRTGGISPMPLCSQLSVDSKEGIVGCGYSDSEMRDEDAACKAARSKEH